VSNGSVTFIESVAAKLNIPLKENFSPNGQFLYVLSTGHTVERQPSIYVYDRSSNCGLTQVQVMSNGIPNEDVSVFGEVGLAIFGI